MENSDNINQEQFLRLLMLNDRRIYAYILSIVPNVSDADDIMQETSAIMWRKFSDFKSDMSFVAWGLTIARYQIMSYLKKRKRSKVCFSEDLTKLLEKEAEKTLSEMDDRLDALKHCIKKLNLTDQDLLKLRYERNLTLQNIGAHISKSTRASFYSLSRIHKLLLRCIKGELSLRGVLDG